ncbi:DUF1853 family protein [Halomonas icarae]|uniref:DUF1853 family protein n=1 Tax=Halomonas icarae TaxID=2691040 RepID=A0A7X5ALY1_9GAMM|nr:DUF1853 family protein [Halomonas icarae]MDR5902016.1 DUF1853 family protein [Halomonas icarae]NAW12284.1 DUF1853 family protein [Halomonas icarae]
MPTDAPPLLDHCHHPLVRDLAWLLLAPDLIAMPWPGRPSREQLGLQDDDRTADWLDQLEAWPRALESQVGDALQGRMGLYHERLWQFLLDTAPGTELLAHNLPILDGKLTLGELDLLYRCHAEASITHLEVAIKFYLGLVESPGDEYAQARWIGPGGADSLAGKREHLHRHQLRMTERPETLAAIKATLAQPGDRGEALPSLTSRVAMPGVLFTPWHHPLPPPREATQDHLRGLWLHWRDWHRFRDGLPRGTRGTRLLKPHWLALPRPEHLQPLRELEARLVVYFRTPAPPLQIALWHPEAGWRRLFIVADDWPRQIPLPPPPIAPRPSLSGMSEAPQGYPQ